MKSIFLALLLLMNGACLYAQMSLKGASVDGPFPVGKEYYPVVDGEKVKKATEVFVSTSGIEVTDMVVSVPSALLQTKKVVGGYDLWLDPTQTKKEVKLLVKTVNGETIIKLAAGKKDKLKADKKYVVSLKFEGKDQNEGMAYIILKSKKDTKVEITGGDEKLYYDVKADDKQIVKLPYGSYILIASDGQNRRVHLKDRPVIVEL